MSEKWTKEEIEEASKKYPYLQRYFDNVYASPLIPENLDAYPFVIACDKNTMSIVALNPKRGYIMLKNGRKTEPESLENY
jgi:hypothetical protein